MKTLLVLISFFISTLAYSAPSTVIRYAVRSTFNGDTEMHIKVSDGSFTIRKEVKKPNCNDLWDKKCFDEKTYKGTIPIKTVKSIMESITKADLFKSKIDAFPKPGEEQYSIGLLEDRDKARYSNCTQGKLENNSKYRKIQQELQKIVDKQIK